LRRYFETDSAHVVLAVLTELVRQKKLEAAVTADALARYGINPDADDPRLVH
jgi:pyruvate dehydrogenase E1 component